MAPTEYGAARGQVRRKVADNGRTVVLGSGGRGPGVLSGGVLLGCGGHARIRLMLRQIDAICQNAGVYPHAFLSAHQHNYQRYTRTLQFAGKEIEVPFVVCGSGGHHINPIVQGRRGHLAQRPRFGDDVGYLDTKPTVEARGLILENYDDNKSHYGYLRVTVTAEQLRIAFQVTDEDVAQAQADLVTVDLATLRLAAN